MEGDFIVFKQNSNRKQVFIPGNLPVTDAEKFNNSDGIKSNMIILIIFLLLIVQSSSAKLLLEVETFENKGGWLIDHQAFEKIGSAYLIAHGKGKPVEDAYTEVFFKEAGSYHVYVHTYNWTSPWYSGEGPGAFNLLVNGEELPNKLGKKGSRWEWQYAGTAWVNKKATIALQDLTGFNGRVDAIYFSKTEETLPNSLEDLHRFRKELNGAGNPIPNTSDLVVVGAGVAGITAALTAARYGVKVALVDNLPKLGGNNYLGIELSGEMNKNLYPRLGDIVREISGIPYYKESSEQPHMHGAGGTGYPMERKTGKEMADYRVEALEKAGVLIFHNIHVYKVKTASGKILSVTGRNLYTGEDKIFKGKLFVDCTGDGTVGYLAGADFHIGRESREYANESLAPVVSDQKKMGITIKWSSVDTEEPSFFPELNEIPWAMECTDQYHIDAYGSEMSWETGFEIDSALEAELVRDNALRAIFGNWSYLKNNKENYVTLELKDVGHIGLKRESRRLLGDVIINENDFRNQVEYPDASYTTTWPFDLHYPLPENSRYFPGWEWQSYSLKQDPKTWIKPYSLPYRTLYSRNVDNLFMAGRCISVTHVALGPVRVQNTTGMMGEVVGMAAKICVDNDALPRDVYEKYLYLLKQLMNQGALLIAR